MLHEYITEIVQSYFYVSLVRNVSRRVC